jgi:hypothetical protein
MEIVINPTAQRIWRTPKVLQIGLGPEHVVLENLQPKHELFIDALFNGLSAEQTQIYARHLKLGAKETQALLAALEPVLLVQTIRMRLADAKGKTLATEIEPAEYAEVASLPKDSPAYQSGLGEMNQISKTHSARGETFWLGRRERAVFIDSLGATGMLIAQGFAAAGIGALVIGDLTASRIELLEHYLDSLPQRPAVFKLNQLKDAQIGRINLAILTGQQLIRTQQFAAWINRGVPALAVVTASAAEKLEPFVSHVIEPGITPCWVCLESERLRLQPQWPDMASQLVDREMNFESASVSLKLAGEALEIGLNFVDRLNGMKNSQISQADAEPKWSFSDDCACRLTGSDKNL